MVAETIAPGQTADVLIAVPATAAASTLYPIYDASLALNNSTRHRHRRHARVHRRRGTASGTDTTGPVTSDVALALPGGP